jgi:hypothetical protein
MGQNTSIPNFANLTQFKVMVGDVAFVVPDVIESVSPAGAVPPGLSSSGLSPTDLFNTRRQGVGGHLFVAFSDAAGPTALDFQVKIFPGDSIVLTTALGIATVQITNLNGIITRPLEFPFTAVGGVQGYFS